MRVSDSVWGFLTAIVVMGIVYMVVRPTSPASEAVVNVTNTLAGMIKMAVQGGTQ